MVQLAAQLKKIEFVMEVARKDPEGFLQDLRNDPFRTLQQSGIDLSPGETMAVIDVVKGTSFSPLAPRLSAMRSLWENICLDNPSRMRRTAKGVIEAVG
jgi:hypothetical protein